MRRGIKARGTIRNDPERQEWRFSRENGESVSGENSLDFGESYSSNTVSAKLLTGIDNDDDGLPVSCAAISILAHFWMPGRRDHRLKGGGFS